MNLAKVGAILRREYVESVRKKSFLFGLVATPLLMIFMIYFPLAARHIVAGEALHLAIVDRAGGWAEPVRGELLAEEGGRRAPPLTVEIVAAEAADAPLAHLEERVRAGELTGWILFPADFDSTGRFQYSAETITDPAALERIEARVERVVSRRRAAQLGLPPESMDALLAPVAMKTFQIGREGEREADFTAVYLRAVTFVLVLFFALMPTGQILMRSVIEEKSNRVIEVLLSSVTPRELMVGKIFGLGAVGLTMLAAWACCAVLLALRGGAAGGGIPWDPRLALVFLLYFVPGYFFYAAVLASIGSICTSEREAQPFLTPISLLLVLPVMIGLVIAQNPDHALVRVLSFVPFVAPSLMLFRHAIRAPAVWETAATWGFLVACTAAMIAASARIFEVGVLMTGKRPTIPELLRLVRERDAS